MPDQTHEKNALFQFRTFLRNELVLGFERYLNIRTCSMSDQLDEGQGPVLYHDGIPYETINYFYLHWILALTKLKPWDVVYDLGAGMGRFLCLAARRNIRKCVGIEYSRTLCEIAERNAAMLRGRKAPIEIVCRDAAQADLTSGTVFYMYNPFGPGTMRMILDNIRSSLRVNPRPISFIYTNPVHEDLFRGCGFLHKTGQVTTPFNLKVSFWRH